MGGGVRVRCKEFARFGEFRSHLFEVGEVGSVVEMGFAQYFGEYWSATEDDSNYELSFCSHMAYMISCNRDNGLSVRLVKDL